MVTSGLVPGPRELDRFGYFGFGCDVMQAAVRVGRWALLVLRDEAMVLMKLLGIWVCFSKSTVGEAERGGVGYVLASG